MSLVPNTDPPRPPVDEPAPRWPGWATKACLLGAIVSLVVTVAVTPVAGWIFLAFLFAWLGASLLAGVSLRRWKRQLEGDSSVLRSSTLLRIIRAVAFVLGGIGGALLATRLARPRYVAYPGFIVGGAIVDLAVTSFVLLRVPSVNTPERAATAPERRLDWELGVVASTLLQTTSEVGWDNLVARAVTTAYEAGRAAALAAADPRLATRMTLKRERLPGASAEVAQAWAEVIDGARRGIIAAQADSRDPPPSAMP